MSPWFFYDHEVSWICKHLFVSFPCVAFGLLHADADNSTLSHQHPASGPASPHALAKGPVLLGLPASSTYMPFINVATTPAGRIKSFSEEDLLY